MSRAYGNSPRKQVRRLTISPCWGKESKMDKLWVSDDTHDVPMPPELQAIGDGAVQKYGFEEAVAAQFLRAYDDRYVSDPNRNPILEKIDKFCYEHPGAEYGPAHIVLSDYNLDDYCIGYCQGLIQGTCPATLVDGKYIHPDPTMEATSRFLSELLQIDEEERNRAQHGDDEDEDEGGPDAP